MSELIATLPSRINSTVLQKNRQNQQFIQFTIDQQPICPQSFEWDSDAINIEHSPLASINKIDYQLNTISLQFENEPLLSEVLHNRDIDDQGKINILFQLVVAIYQLHKRGILGRCFSIQTITLNNKNEIKIYRYGYSHNFSQDGEFIVSAPETVFEDKRQVSSDIWMIGLLFYEIVFKKPIINLKYPEKKEEYNKFISDNQQRGNTFENLYDAGEEWANLLQLLLKFDSDSRLESYWVFVDCLSNLLSENNKKSQLKEIRQFYQEDNDKFQQAMSIIDTRSKQRDPRKQLQKISKRSKSQLASSNKEALQFFSTYRLHTTQNGQYLRQAYQTPVTVNLLYRYDASKKKQIQQIDIQFLQNEHFQLYKIAFIQNLRLILTSFDSDSLLVAKYDSHLLLAVYEIIQKQKQRISNNLNSPNNNFKSDTMIVFKRIINLEKYLKPFVEIVEKLKLFQENEKPPFMFHGYNDGLSKIFNSLKQSNHNHPNLNDFLDEINIRLRVQIALNAEALFSDISKLNNYFSCTKNFLGVSQITDPIQIERFLQRANRFDLNRLKLALLNVNEEPEQ